MCPLESWDSEVLSAVTVVTNWLLPLEFLSLVSWGLLTKQVEREDHLPHPVVPHSLHLFLLPSHILLAPSYHLSQKLKNIFSPFSHPENLKILRHGWIKKSYTTHMCAHTHIHTRTHTHTHYAWRSLALFFSLMKVCILYDLRALSCYSLLKYSQTNQQQKSLGGEEHTAGLICEDKQYSLKQLKVTAKMQWLLWVSKPQIHFSSCCSVSNWQVFLIRLFVSTLVSIRRAVGLQLS